MARVCDICGKRRQVGNNVSHSNRKTKRVFNPNLQKIRITGENGAPATANVCTRCIRAGKVTKPAARQIPAE